MHGHECALCVYSYTRSNWLTALWLMVVIHITTSWSSLMRGEQFEHERIPCVNLKRYFSPVFVRVRTWDWLCMCVCERKTEWYVPTVCSQLESENQLEVSPFQWHCVPRPIRHQNETTIREYQQEPQDLKKNWKLDICIRTEWFK